MILTLWFADFWGQKTIIGPRSFLLASTSHTIFHPLHRKYCFQNFVNPTRAPFEDHCSMWYELITLRYFVKAMELLCYNRSSQVKNQLLISHKKRVIQLHQQGASFKERWGGKAPPWPFRSAPARQLRHSSI